MHLKKFTKPVHIKFPTNNSKETRILNIDKSLMNKTIICVWMNKTITYLCMTNFHGIYYYKEFYSFCSCICFHNVQCLNPWPPCCEDNFEAVRKLIEEEGTCDMSIWFEPATENEVLTNVCCNSSRIFNMRFMEQIKKLLIVNEALITMEY